MDRHNMFKRSLWKHYLVSFVLVFMVSILLSIIVFSISIENLSKEEMAAANMALVTKARDVMDIRIRELYDISVQISMNTSIRKFLYKKQPLSSMDIYSFKDIMDVLRGYNQGNGFINFLAIYFPQSNTVITAEGKYDADYFFNNVIKYQNINQVKLQQILSAYNYEKVIPLNTINGKANINGNYITYVQSLPIGEMKPLANIIMLISDKTIYTTIGNTLASHKGKLGIVTEDKDIIAFDEDADVINTIFNQMDNEINTFMLENNSNIVVSHITSNVLNWDYLAISDINDILNKVLYLRDKAIIAVFLNCIIGIALSIFMTEFSYKPWKNLTSNLKQVYDKLGINYRSVNEYEYARNIFDNVVAQNGQMRSKLDISKKHIKGYILKDLCIGNDVLYSEMLEADIIFKYNLYTVAIIKVSNDVKEQAIYLTKVINGLEDIKNDNYLIYPFKDREGRIGIIINIEHESDDVKSFIRYIKDIVDSNLDCSSVVGLGNIHEDYKSVYLSYNEAKKALNYVCFNTGEPKVGYFQDIQCLASSIPDIPIESNNPLLNTIKTGNYEACKNLLDNVISTNVTTESLQYFYCIYYDLASIVLKACRELDLDFYSIFAQSPDRLLEPRYEDPKQLLDYIYSIYQTACNYISNNKKSHNVELKAQIEKYINAYFSDKNLSLRLMADELGCTSSYLSRFMKEQCGTGFGDFLNNVRLEAAKKLLTIETYSINKIADMVGYNSVNSFIRSFKRKEGITPGQYREMMANVD